MKKSELVESKIPRFLELDIKALVKEAKTDDFVWSYMPDMVKGRYNRTFICNVLETLLPGWIAKMSGFARNLRIEKYTNHGLTALSMEYKITPEFMRLIAEA